MAYLRFGYRAAGWQYLVGLGQGPPGGCISSESYLVLEYGAVSPIVRVHGPRNQEMGGVPLVITSSDPQAKFWLSV